MNPCAGRRGFLTLSSCGEPAGRNCAVCSRPMCPEHLSPSSGFTKCLECANGKGPARTAQTPTPLDNRPVIDDSDDYYTYRRSYYSDRSYTPRSDWDRSDSRAFAHGAAAGVLAGDDDEGHPGFGDS